MKEITFELIKYNICTYSVPIRTRWKRTGWIDKKVYTILCSAETVNRGGNDTDVVVLKMLDQVK
jgi:hypothetical protein